MAPLTVLHVTGSPTSQHMADLSRLYARDCLAAVADPARYAPVVADVSPDGTWRFADDLGDEALAAATPHPLPAAVERLAALAPDVAVPQLFCLPGLTTYRSLLDLLGVPSVGNAAQVMGLTADKARTRAVVAAAGLDVPEGEVVPPGGAVTLAPPVVVKPVAADNSAGVTLVREPAELDAALDVARAHGRDVLVERYVPPGREVRCGTIVRGGRLVALPLEEYAVDADDKPVRDAADKLRRDRGGALELVAKDTAHAWIVDPGDPVTAPVQAAALAAHVALGCRHHGLFDFRLDDDGRPWFLEAGPYCSFARQSVVVAMADAAGIGVAELFADAVAQASTPAAC